MYGLIESVKKELVPSFGVTEPAAIAYAAAAARCAVGGTPTYVFLKLNSGIYKNSFTCAVPNTRGMGCALAGALGAVCGDPQKGLMCLENVDAEDECAANTLVKSGCAAVEISEISSDISIYAAVKTECGVGEAIILGRHDNLVSVKANEVELIVSSVNDNISKDDFERGVWDFTLREILDCVQNASADETAFLKNAVDMDMRLFKRGDNENKLVLTRSLVNGQNADSMRNTAVLYTCGAIEARVRGAASPAMAITGSGSHGILAFLPIHAARQYIENNDSENDSNFSRSRISKGKKEQNDIQENRALLLSALVTMYIKHFSGRLSAACGCVLAGGAGAAAGLTYLLGGGYDEICLALNSMAASVTGMICHGGNTGCSLKALVGVDMAFSSAKMALSGCGAESIHGILAESPEMTMKNMGYVSEGMYGAEKYIIDIFRKRKGKLR